MQNLNCPNCGSDTPILLKHTKVSACQFCDTTLLVDDTQVRMAGKQGVMHDAPLLFGIGDLVRLGRHSIQIFGHARYSYGPGFWDEFCGTDQFGASHWISVDEGDIALQTRLLGSDVPKISPPFELGHTLDFGSTTFKVTEVETAECTALRGQFDEVLQVGERHEFVNASAGDDTLLSGEFWDGNAVWFQGRWFDPFELEVERLK